MRRILSVIALSAIALGGCQNPYFGTPNLAHPGTEDYQQARAVQKSEPFPDNNIGPPVVGARPREYQDQEAQVTHDLRDKYAPVLVPGTPQPFIQPVIAQPQIVQPQIVQPQLSQPQIVQPAIEAPPPAAIYTPPPTPGTLQQP
jgi:hypothetical protein